MLQFLKEPNIGQYLQSLTGWYRGCCCVGTLGVQGWSSIDVNVLHSQVMRHITRMACPGLGLKCM